MSDKSYFDSHEEFFREQEEKLQKQHLVLKKEIDEEKAAFEKLKNHFYVKIGVGSFLILLSLWLLMGQPNSYYRNEPAPNGIAIAFLSGLFSISGVALISKAIESK